MWGEMGWCGVLECGMVPPQSSRHVVGGGGVTGMCGCPIPHLQKKKSGLHPTTPATAFFYLSTYQTKSNPDMRNSKLAHTQAGF